MITHDPDAVDGQINDRFILHVSTSLGITEEMSDADRRLKISQLPEIKWLQEYNIGHSLWWTDWDYGWAHPRIKIKDADKAALFKLMFHA